MIRISIYAPAWRPTRVSFLQRRQVEISIHAPRTGATTGFGCARRTACIFQSTPPYGSDPKRESALAHDDRDFNPRPRMEGDGGRVVIAKQSHCFNPRPRTEGDMTGPVRSTTFPSTCPTTLLARSASPLEQSKAGLQYPQHAKTSDGGTEFGAIADRPCLLFCDSSTGKRGACGRGATNAASTNSKRGACAGHPVWANYRQGA